MSFRLRTDTSADPRTASPASAEAAGWERRRLMLVLTAAALAALVLLGGLGYAVYLVVDPASSTQPSTRLSHWSRSRTPQTGTPNAPSPVPGRGQAYRDAVAAAPMLTVPPTAMRPTDPAPVAAATISIAMPTGDGPAQVPTGFPHTPQGAVGQLAAIETTVLQAMSIVVTNRIYQAWVLPDHAGGGVSGWELTQDVQAFLGATSSGPQMDLATTVRAQPAAGLVKGTDGPDWTLACVLLQIRATVATDVQIGYGYCAPMQWTTSNHGPGRWMIAPGRPAAQAPSTWPGSVLALKAGWRTWAWATAPRQGQQARQ